MTEQVDVDSSLDDRQDQVTQSISAMLNTGVWNFSDTMPNTRLGRTPSRPMA